MKHNALTSLGGTCSILLGISIIMVGITYLRLPSEQQQLVHMAWAETFLLGDKSREYAQSAQPGMT